MEANIWPREPSWAASPPLWWVASFLSGPARARFQQQVLRESLEALPVTRLMRTQLERLTPGLPVEDLVSHHVVVEDQHVWPVESGGVLLGLVSTEDLHKVNRADWNHTAVREVMTPVSRLAVLRPDADAAQALAAMADHQVDELPVLDRGHLLGLVRGKDLLHWLATRR